MMFFEFLTIATLVVVSDEVAVEMVKTYQANARDGLKGQIAGMQAAYRLFLDRVEL